MVRRTKDKIWRRRSVRLGVVTVEALDVVGDDERGSPRPPLGPRGRRSAVNDPRVDSKWKLKEGLLYRHRNVDNERLPVVGRGRATVQPGIK